MARFGLATLNHSPLFGTSSPRVDLASLEAILDSAQAAGFDALAPDIFWLRALEASGVKPESVSDALNERGLSTMEIAGLAIGSQEQTAAELAENLRYAQLLEAEFVNTRVTAPPNAAIAESLRRCAETLATVGTRIALEFSNGTQLQDLNQAQAFLESAAADGVGLTLDTWHFFQARGGPDWEALDELPLEWLANVQLSDGVSLQDQPYSDQTMHHRRFAGSGEFDLARCQKCLLEKGFDGAIVVEVLNRDLRKLPVVDFATKAARSSHAWWTATAFRG